MRSKIVVFIMLCTLLIFSSSISAQGATLVPNTAQLSTLTPESPVGVYTLSGTQGDIVQIWTVALDADLQLVASLNSPGQQNIGTSRTLPGGHTASLSAQLPTTGVYTLLIGGNPGNYLVSFSSVSAGAPLEIASQSAQAVLLDGASPQIIAFSTQNDTSALTLSVNDAIHYQASLIKDSGEQVGTANGLSAACFVVDANASYSLMLVGEDGATGQVNVSLGGNCGAGETAANAPVQSSAPAATSATGNETVCTAYGNGAVNVRSGSGTEFSVVGTLAAGSPATVTGRTPNNWLQVQFGGGSGFVFADVVNLSGPCQNLASIPNSAPGAQQQQPAPTASQPETNDPAPIQPTTTPPPQQGGQEQPTQTPTVSAQVAPPDSNYAFNIPLDGTVSLSDYVSYPDGDTEDAVSYAATGLNPTSALPGGLADLTISLSCAGTGTEHIIFRIGQSTYTCGQTFVRRVNADSRTGAIRIIATGGTNTYVQWTLNATLPRAN